MIFVEGVGSEKNIEGIVNVTIDNKTKSETPIPTSKRVPTTSEAALFFH
jgi:hypothetical protein